MNFEGWEFRKKKKKNKKKAAATQPTKEEDDGGGAVLEDCFAKDLSCVLILLVFFFSILDL